MIEIQTLKGVAFKKIHNAFLEAFADYPEPVNLTLSQLQHMVERRGFKADLSMGAFEDGRLVGFILNGVGTFNEKRTAYDTGTGICADFRGQGLGSRLARQTLELLRRSGIHQYLLEVIRTNTPAVKLYEKLGFKKTRQFDYFTADKADLIFDSKDTDGIPPQEIEKPDWTSLKNFWDFYPSWQNSIDAIGRKAGHFKFFGLFEGKTIVGYGVIEPETGDIPQIAVQHKYRKKGLGTMLLKRLTHESQSRQIRIINADIKDTAFKKFVLNAGFTPGHGQYEMLMVF